MHKVKDNGTMVLSSIAGIVIASIVMFVYILWAKPRFLHMPNYEKIDEGGSAETEIV
jgi:hypothetical protein